MICPNCKADYVEGYTECADCRIPLVSPEALSALAKQTPLQPVNYSLVKITAESGDLWFLQSVLEGEGIDYFWHSHHTSMFQFPGQGGLLMVDETRLEDVRQILSDLEIDSDQPNDEDAIESLFKHSHDDLPTNNDNVDPPKPQS